MWQCTTHPPPNIFKHPTSQHHDLFFFCQARKTSTLSGHWCRLFGSQIHGGNEALYGTRGVTCLGRGIFCGGLWIGVEGMMTVGSQMNRFDRGCCLKKCLKISFVLKCFVSKVGVRWCLKIRFLNMMAFQKVTYLYESVLCCVVLFVELEVIEVRREWVAVFTRPFSAHH